MLAIEGFRVGVMVDGVARPALNFYEQTYPWIKGYTTNPSLARQSGVRDYLAYCTAMARDTKLPVSLEVLSEGYGPIYREAHTLSGLGSNVFVKVPVIDTEGRDNDRVIAALAKDSVQLNVTAVMTPHQVDVAVQSLNPRVAAIISVFAGRIADTGIDPGELVSFAKASTHKAHGVLWASTRQVFDIQRADECGADFITVPPSMLEKVALLGKDLDEYSRETVQMFTNDARLAGFTL